MILPDQYANEFEKSFVDKAYARLKKSTHVDNVKKSNFFVEGQILLMTDTSSYNAIPL
jgi:hypothetical protein